MKKQFHRITVRNLILTASMLIILTTCEKPDRLLSFITLEALEADISYTTATLKGEIIDAGSQPVDDYGLVYSTDPNPRIGNATIKSAGTEIKKGVFSITITGLTRNTKYYFRAYVTIDDNDIHSDKIYSFTTKDYQVPSVIAGSVTEITMTSALLNGEVTSDGGEAATTRGLCWGASANPTISSCIDTTVNGTGAGTFTGRMTALSSGTQYYVRAYATNSKGTTYNNSDVVFKTHSLPAVKTAEVTSITGTGATAGGEVTDDGGVEVTARGVCWSTISGPAIALTTKTTDSAGEGAFVSTVTGLTSGTTYYIRAYATNQYGTSYGEEKTFIATKAPQVTTAAATLIGKSSATLNGTVNANSASSSVSFEYGKTTSYGTTITASPETATGNTATAVDADLSALDAGTTYHYRVKAVNSGGTAYGDDMTFTTLQDPGATTTSATNITITSATLNGSVNANNTETMVSFQYGTSTAYGSTIAATPGTVTGNSATSVSANLASLTPGTTYHFRVRAISGAGEIFGADQEFTTLEQPDATTLSATTVTGTTATLNGSVIANNSETTVIFEYGQTTSYGLTVSAIPAQVTGDTPAAVIASLTSLTPATEYHYRVKAESAAGIKYGDDKTFTTSQAPSATTNAATNIAILSATLNGTVNAAGSSTTVTFDYGETTSYGMSVTAIQSPVSAAGNTSVSADISGLTEGILYHFRVKAVNGGGTTYGSDLTFTTITKATVTTTALTGITINSASGGGNVTSDGGSTITMRGVCWSTTENPTVSDLKTENGAASGTFTSSLTGLTSGTTYHVRAYATNTAGTAYGNDVSFITLKLPDAVTASASPVGISTATLNGTVNANGSSTTVTFEYGTLISYGTEVTADQSPVEGNTATAVSKNISGLTPSTTYHYRVKAVSAAGTDYGDDMTFNTNSAPVTVSDFDGNIYNIITIGTQEWMQKNLLVTHYNNGEAIPVVTDNAVWSGLADGAYCWYNNDETTYKNTYGALYNYYTTNDVRNVCPAGWHVPTDGEWTTLTDFLGGLTVAGGKLKEAGTAHWTDPNTGATNETGFTALPGGYRNDDGTYSYIGNYGNWRSSTEDNTVSAWYINMSSGYNHAVRGSSGKKNGYSIRCLHGNLALAETNAAAEVTTTNATLNGKANPNGIATTISFEYGTTTAYGSAINADQSPSSLSVPIVATASLTSLSPGTEYHYRIKAENLSGITYGSDKTFSTSSLTPPTATTGSATGVGATTAVLNGMVNANGLSTTVTFEYGTSTSYGTEVAASESPVNGSISTPVSVGLSGLSTSVTYHYRVKAVSTGGTDYGEDQSFTPHETVMDYDGNVYNVITIGTQDWMQKNLLVTHYNNGEAIPVVTDNATWSGLINGAYCWYNNDEATYKNTYGALYNYYTTSDVRNVCPAGWHVPIDDEWTTMENYLIASGYNYDGTTSDNKIAKALGSTTSWTFTTFIGTVGNTDYPAMRNSTGFTALPGGYEHSTGAFNDIYNRSFHWTSTESSGTDAFYRGMGWDAISLAKHFDYKQDGFSVRCLRGALPLAETNYQTGVTSTNATLNGKANPNGIATAITFEYGTTASYGSTITADQSPLSLSVPVTATASLTTLTPGTEYHYRIKAENLSGITYGSDMTFNTTALSPPAATTGSATAVASTSATLNGTINAYDQSTTATFEYGETTSYGTEVTADQSPVNGNLNTSVSKGITGLSPLTTYHYRVKAVSAGGTVYGDDATFLTNSLIGTITDYDGNVYNTIEIGTQKWMAENLKTTKFNDGISIRHTNNVWFLNMPAFSYYNEDYSSFGSVYGALYNWKAVNTGMLCPTGWHVPTIDEWNVLIDYLGGQTIAGGKLKEVGTAHWTDPNVGATNESGFTALPGGECLGTYVHIGTEGKLWTYSETDEEYAKYWLLYNNMSDALLGDSRKNNGLSVRCLEGELPFAQTDNATSISGGSATLNGSVYANGVETTVVFEYGTTLSYGNQISPTPNIVSGTDLVNLSVSLSGLTSGQIYHFRIKTGNSGGTFYGRDRVFTADPVTVTDIDGNTYYGVTIGSKTWMSENLKVTKYPDGTPVLDIYPVLGFAGGYRWYEVDFNNDSFVDNADRDYYVDNYGFLYSWEAIMHGYSSSEANPSGVQGLCPTGWHLPSKSEWDELITFVSPDSYLNLIDGGSSGFNAGFGGYHFGVTASQYFNSFGFSSCFWTCTYWSSNEAHNKRFSWGGTIGDDIGSATAYIWNHMSIRCVKD